MDLWKRTKDVANALASSVVSYPTILAMELPMGTLTCSATVKTVEMLSVLPTSTTFKGILSKPPRQLHENANDRVVHLKALQHVHLRMDVLTFSMG
jgi:hypothetical protein